MSKIVTILSTMDSRVLKERVLRGIKTDNIDLVISQCVARLGGYDGYVALEHAEQRGNHKVVGFSMGSGWSQGEAVAVIYWEEGLISGEVEISLNEIRDAGVVTKTVRGSAFDVQQGRIEGYAQITVEDWEIDDAMTDLATMVDTLIEKGNKIRQKRAERIARLEQEQMEEY